MGRDEGNRSIIGAVARRVGSRAIPSLCLDTVDPNRPTYYAPSQVIFGVGAGRGARLADGGSNFSLVMTILPPNSPSCSHGNGDAGDGTYSAGSKHQGGVHVALADGSVQFVTENIDAGDATIGTVGHPNWSSAGHSPPGIESPYGVWGASGTMNGAESESI